MNPQHLITQLEAYTLKRPQEVLLLTLGQETIEDQILIFKGFSSSLMHPTDFNPDNPVVTKNLPIQGIDRLQSPYNPADPIFIEQGLSPAQMHQYLIEVGIT
jgi:hypothetical protein